jgi:hypothetical protein
MRAVRWDGMRWDGQSVVGGVVAVRSHRYEF